jgi:hypothetical protein
VPDAPEIPPVPADVLACVRQPVTGEPRELTEGEVARLWKTDRAALKKVNACLERLVCLYQDVRADIAKVDTTTCAPPTPPRRKLLGHLFHKKKDGK